MILLVILAMKILKIIVQIAQNLIEYSKTDFALPINIGNVIQLGTKTSLYF